MRVVSRTFYKSNIHIKIMKILGINGCGWLNVAHDAAVAFVEKGKIKWAVEEEKFIRQKRAYDKNPFNTTKFCLENKRKKLLVVEFYQ